jgi:hypothetical protein
MKVQFLAHKLENADVSHISLVARGANRAPFKVIKHDKEQDMIDLNGYIKKAMGSSKKSEVKGPVSIALLVSKTAVVEPVLKALKDAGIDIEKKEDVEGAVIFKLSDETVKEEEVSIIKLSQDVAVMVKGFDPYSDTREMKFSEILKAQGFMPGVSMAAEVLRNSISDALFTGENQGDAVKKIEGLLKDFTGYVVQIAKEIPPQVFKAEKAVSDAYKIYEEAKKTEEASKKAADKSAEEMLEAGESDEDIMKAHGLSADDLAALKKKRDEEKKVEASQKSSESQPAVDMKAVATAITKTVIGTVTEQIKQALAPVTESIGKLQTKLDGVEKSQGTLAGKVDEAAALAKKAEKAATSIVGNVAPGDDAHKTAKTDDDEKSELGIIDTAFMPSVRKNDGGTFAQRYHTKRRQAS